MRYTKGDKPFVIKMNGPTQGPVEIFYHKSIVDIYIYIKYIFIYVIIIYWSLLYAGNIEDKWVLRDARGWLLLIISIYIIVIIAIIVIIVVTFHVICIIVLYHSSLESMSNGFIRVNIKVWRESKLEGKATGHWCI